MFYFKWIQVHSWIRTALCIILVKLSSLASSVNATCLAVNLFKVIYWFMSWFLFSLRVSWAIHKQFWSSLILSFDALFLWYFKSNINKASLYVLLWFTIFTTPEFLVMRNCWHFLRQGISVLTKTVFLLTQGHTFLLIVRKVGMEGYQNPLLVTFIPRFLFHNFPRNLSKSLISLVDLWVTLMAHRCPQLSYSLQRLFTQTSGCHLLISAGILLLVLFCLAKVTLETSGYWSD